MKSVLETLPSQVVSHAGALALTGNSWRKMSPEDIHLAKRWYHDDGIKPSEIADSPCNNFPTYGRNLQSTYSQRSVNVQPMLQSMFQ